MCLPTYIYSGRPGTFLHIQRVRGNMGTNVDFSMKGFVLLITENQASSQTYAVCVIASTAGPIAPSGASFCTLFT